MAVPRPTASASAPAERGWFTDTAGTLDGEAPVRADGELLRRLAPLGHSLNAAPGVLTTWAAEHIGEMREARARGPASGAPWLQPRAYDTNAA